MAQAVRVDTEDRYVVTFKNILAVQWRGWLLMMATLAPIPVCYLIRGNDLFRDPVPVSTELATIWFAINGFLCFIGSSLTLRTIWLYRPQWTMQEIWILRGAFYLTIGGGLGYWTHAFLQDARITIGTPYLTLGSLAVIYGMWKLPERFTHRHEEIP